MRVAFVGLGVMGYPMAGFLAGAGHEVTVSDLYAARFDPVGGNPGTTLGAQRLEVFQYAAAIWAARNHSDVEIKVEAKFDLRGIADSPYQLQVVPFLGEANDTNLS